jgi:RNA-directed DNA polymerase
MEKNQFYPTKQGTPQGGIASPTLANMVLDGLEQQVRSCSTFKDHGKGRKSTVDRINLIRYCDDFIVTAKSREILEEKVKPVIESFLKERGLSFSEEKTRILSIEEGFDFLGQNVRKYDRTLLIKPAKKNIPALKDKLKVIFAKMKAAPAWALIRTLNPILKGWAYYHRHIVAKKTFSDVDEFVYAKLVRWMKRRHPNKSWRWKIHQYFLTRDGWQFHGGGPPHTDREGKSVRLFHTQKVVIKRHVKVKSDANPYDPAWEMYFERRQEQKMQVRIKPRGGRPSFGYSTGDSMGNVRFAKPRLRLKPDGSPLRWHTRATVATIFRRNIWGANGH